MIIDYLIPPMKKAGSYAEYSELSDLISQYSQTMENNPQLAAKNGCASRRWWKNWGC
ncbi:hypothetical protein DSCOOX_56290 [Desulfosarcina ovata subsp. ovata]|uniref:CobN/magnesium chelatase domain-containing protein n=1 Tax=Desulfosarcina ovata subsp. ovata TaxID=2752305 RepID=A0A5K8AIW7_9BACT|nr:hypothetical protein DSCOOX_56290 [Desulfosarcina ovata subsp. ovata]